MVVIGKGELMVVCVMRSRRELLAFSHEQLSSSEHDLRTTGTRGFKSTQLGALYGDPPCPLSN